MGFLQLEMFMADLGTSAPLFAAGANQGTFMHELIRIYCGLNSKAVWVLVWQLFHKLQIKGV